MRALVIRCALVLVAALVGAGCRPGAAGPAGGAAGKPIVVTSFLPLYCWTKAVAGDAARVENLLTGHAEPHDYAFSPKDARRLNQADLIVLNGLGLEPWLPKWRANAAGRDSKALDVSVALPQDQLIGTAASRNPHYWLDPLLAIHAVTNISANLQRIDPTNATVYASNAAVYVGLLQKLDADIRSGLAPLTNRAIVTYHDAFPYFARRYGLEVAGVVEEVAGVEPTPLHLTRLHKTIADRKIRAIFVAHESSSRVTRQIAKDTGVKLVELDTLESGKLDVQTYEQKMRANVIKLRETLQ